MYKKFSGTSMYHNQKNFRSLFGIERIGLFRTMVTSLVRPNKVEIVAVKLRTISLLSMLVYMQCYADTGCIMIYQQHVSVAVNPN